MLNSFAIIDSLIRTNLNAHVRALSFTPTHPMLTHCQHVFRCLSLTLNINT